MQTEENTASNLLSSVSFLMPTKTFFVCLFVWLVGWFFLKKFLPTKQLEQRMAGSGKAYNSYEIIHKIRMHILIKPHS